MSIKTYQLLCFCYICVSITADMAVAAPPFIPVPNQPRADGNLRSETPIRLTRFEHAGLDIVIDGHIDEQVWDQLRPLGDLRITRPDTQAKPRYETIVKMFYTEQGLYASLDMQQPIETIIRRHAPRDSLSVSRDRAGFTLDSSGDGRYGTWVELALGGGQMDGTILPERQWHSDWDGAWYGATKETENGWSAEYFLPWSQVPMPRQKGDRRIGIFVSRRVAHLDELWSWPALTDTHTRFLSDFYLLQIERVNPAQQWSLIPYLSQSADLVSDQNLVKAGADFFWRPTSNLQLSATVTPDFGAVEADNVIVNLTANETYFPEKRLFFLEGQDVFSTTPGRAEPGSQRLDIVNTRRIGGKPRALDLPIGVTLSRREALKNADLIGAAKATGQFGEIRFGLLGATEDITEYIADDGQAYLQHGRDFGVMRLLYEDNKRGAYRGMGWISTIVAHPDSDSIVHAADFHYLSSSGKWSTNGRLLYSDNDDSATGKGITGNFSYTPRRGLEHIAEMSSLDDKIDVNALGFQARNDALSYRYRLIWTKSGLARIRDFRLSSNFSYEQNGAGFATKKSMWFQASTTLNNLHKLDGLIGHSAARYDDQSSFGNGLFEVVDRTTLDISYRTNLSMPIGFSAKVRSRGELLYGRTITSALGVIWRPVANLNMELHIAHDRRSGWLLHQDGRNFTSFKARQWQPELKLEYFPTARQELRAVLQWAGVQATEDRFFELPHGDFTLDEVDKPPGDSDDFGLSQLNFQIRYRWQFAPLSDLFIVYTKGDVRRTEIEEFGELIRGSWHQPTKDEFVAKVRYRFGS